MKLRNFIKRLKKAKAEEKPYSGEYPQSVEDAFNVIKTITDEDMRESLILAEEKHEDVFADLTETFNAGFRPIFSAYDKINGIYMRDRLVIEKLSELRLAVLELLDFQNEHFTPQGK